MSEISLYKVASQVEALLNSEDAFDPETGELSPALVEALELTKDRGAAVVGYLLNQDAVIVAIEAHEAKIKARKEAIVKKQQRLREYLAENMKRCGITEIKAADGTFGCKLYKERDASVDVFDEKQVPFKYWTTPKTPEPKVSKTELMRDLKQGVEIPGARIAKKDRLEIN